MNDRPDIAYYYPAPYWGLGESGWMKSLLLFFDQIAILLPRYMHGRHAAADPFTVMPLEERGLLQVLEPNDWIDQETAERLAEVVVDLLTDGAFDDLPMDVPFRELSQSRLGHGTDVGLADMLIEELTAKGFARPSEDGLSIPLQPTLRMTILVILGQLSRVAGARKDLNIHPVTNDQHAITELTQTLSRASMPSTHKVITLDLAPVSFDLASVPLDDILDFREEHRPEHRQYMRDLHRFMAELAVIDDVDNRERLLVERRQEIADASQQLQLSTRRWLGRNLPPMSFGLAGAAWSISHGDPVGLALAAAALMSQIGSKSPRLITAYSYMFSVGRQFGGGIDY